MAIRVLIVDDSSFFRRRISEIVSKDPVMEVAGMAANGRDAVKMVEELKPDVITMDVEMPIMNGIDAVRKIMEVRPTPIIMFSSLTLEGATLTFNALEAGALDFITKNFDEIARDRATAMDLIRTKIKDIARQKFRMAPKSVSGATSGTTGTSSSAVTSRTTQTRVLPSRTSLSDRVNSLSSFRTSSSQSSSGNTPLSSSFRKAPPSSVPELQSVAGYRPTGKKYSLIAIGSSTGGPMALQEILVALPENLPVPLVIVQHMPATFTRTFAARLDKICKVTVSEAADGDILQPGHVYIAPGGMQMTVEGRGTQTRLRIQVSDPTMTFRPCVDNTFTSINATYGGAVLALILTGMGSDGKEGCAKLRHSGSTVWAQNEATCTIYGMPQAIVNAGIAQLAIPLPEIGKCIIKEVMGH